MSCLEMLQFSLSEKLIPQETAAQYFGFLRGPAQRKVALKCSINSDSFCLHWSKMAYSLKQQNNLEYPCKTWFNIKPNILYTNSYSFQRKPNQLVKYWITGDVNYIRSALSGICQNVCACHCTMFETTNLHGSHVFGFSNFLS